jgi:hypothetical protein
MTAIAFATGLVLGGSAVLYFRRILLDAVSSETPWITDPGADY